MSRRRIPDAALYAAGASLVVTGCALIAAWTYHTTVVVAILGILALAGHRPIGLFAPPRRPASPRRPAAAPATKVDHRPLSPRRPAAPAAHEAAGGRARQPNSGRARQVTAQQTHLPTVTYRPGRQPVIYGVPGHDQAVSR